MPSVVKGGRKQSGAAPARRQAAASPRGRTPARAAPSNGPPPIVIWSGLGLACAAVLAGVIYVWGGAALAWTGHKIDLQMASMGFRLERVHIRGASGPGQRAIMEAAGLHRGQPLAFADIGALQDRIEQVGWVSEARVIRLLPDTLVIAVTERRPVAVWQSAGAVRVVDGQGAVIVGADPGRFAELPLVVGEGAGEASAELIPLIEAWPRLRDRVDAAVRVDQRRWNLLLKDGSVIQLPADGVDAALVQLEAMDQRERLLDVGFARVDLRAPESVAIEPRTTAAT